jgi:predicted O-methyltransferase YrrM
MIQKLRIVFSYLGYLFRAKTKYTIHSPFLYNLVITVFNDSSKYPAFRPIEKLRKQLLSDSRLVAVTDFGAGSKVLQNPNRTVRDITRTSSKPVRFGQLLFRLSKHFRPKTIIELGTSVGLSTAWLAAGNPDAQVYTIEGCPETAAIGSETFHKLQVNNITLINGHFDVELPLLLGTLKEVDMVFIDGNHKWKPTVSYFEQCLSKSVNETCFVIDDIHWSDEMEKAWQEIKDNKRVTMTVDLFFSGLVFVNQGLSKQDLVLRY